ncbi:MAG: penicillin-binding protein 2 [Pseudomonadota bacterium]|nr:penicillin-binding protein 2 [Pseudomonadota bacterium]
MNRKTQVIRFPAWRSRMLLLLLLMGFVVLAGRSFFLQVINTGFLQAQGDSRIERVIQLPAHRGMITDRYGEPLAISTPMESIAASPQDVHISQDQFDQLKKLLDLSGKELKEKLYAKRDFIYLKRQIPPVQAKAVKALNIPGVFLQQEYKRFYPAGEMIAHVIGFTNINDAGQEGVELAYQKWLAGIPGSQLVIKDNRGQIIEDAATLKAPIQGHDLSLSIDRRLQYLAFRELAKGVEQSKASSGSIVMLDARTGEILALANIPTFNPNNRENLIPGNTRDRAVTDSFEPGSVMKPFLISAALKAGKITPQTLIQTAPGYWTVEGRVIHDADPKGLITVSQVIKYSSNVGASKIALMLKPEVMWKLYHSVGFGEVPGSGLPGEVAGDLHPWADWRPINQATMSYGNGVSVSLLQLARAYTIFTNGGVLLPVSIIKRTDPPVGQRIISSKIASEVRHMMEMVTEPGGTAPNVAIPGYRIAGKTGTAHQAINGSYANNHYYASFVGFAPASNPKFIIAVTIHDPYAKNGNYYGAEVAGPVFRGVMVDALRMLDVPPDAPNQIIAKPQNETVSSGNGNSLAQEKNHAASR